MTRELTFRRNALLLWSAQFISVAGDALFMPCLAWLAAATGDRESLVGLAVFFAFLPYLLLGPIAGAWVDRTDQRRVMVLSDLLRAALLMSIPLLAALWGGVSFGLIVGVGFLLATFSTPFLPARDTLLPTLIGARSLPRWNAVMQTSGQLAMVVGLGLGGLLLGLEGSEDEIGGIVRVMQIDGATYLVSAILLMCMVLPKRDRTVRHKTRLLSDARAGLAFGLKDPLTGGLLLLTALDNLAIMGPAIVGAQLLVEGEFGLGPGAYAWFEGCMAVGMVLGSLALATLGRRWPMRKVVLWGMVMDGLTYLPYIWIEDYALSLVVIVAHGVFIPLIVVGRTSLIQRHVPADRHGKVFALVSITVVGMTALSAALSGWIAELTSPRVLFGIAGVFGALCGVVGFFAWRWREPAAASSGRG